MRPVHAGARFDVAFDVVRVQFHQPGHDVIPAAIQRAVWHRVALGEFRDQPVFDGDGAKGDAVGQHQPGVGKAQVVRWCTALRNRLG